MTEELAVYKNNQVELATGNEMYFDVQKFEQAQRIAKMLSSSTMVPEHFRNNVGNCMIGLNFAGRVGLDPFMVLQKMYIIKGRPGIESQLMIALINKSGRFTPLKFRISGEGKSYKCTCYATEIRTGEVCEQTVTWKMVEAEGWDKKQGSKWQTLPELMLQYRAAAFFGRLFCPEVLLGMLTKEELYDIDTPQTPAPITNLANRLKEIESVPAPEKPNPLHKTEAWKKWVETRDSFPELSGSLPEPKDEESCIQATNIVEQEVDKQNA